MALEQFIVLDKNKKLLGTLSGDIYTALIKNAKVSEIDNYYNKYPKKIFIQNLKNTKLKKMFINYQFGLMPVVDKKKFLKKIITWNDVFSQ